MLERGIEDGAKLLAGGGIPVHLNEGFYLQPTAFYRRRSEIRIGAGRECSDPVTVIMPFQGRSGRACALPTDTQFGLAASVWTTDVARAHRVASKLVFGMVWINDHHRLDPASPWGRLQEQRRGAGNRDRILRSIQRAARGHCQYQRHTTVDWYADDGQLKRLQLKQLKLITLSAWPAWVSPVVFGYLIEKTGSYNVPSLISLRRPQLQ